MKRIGATGPDDIPPPILNALGPKGRSLLLVITNQLLNKTDAPQSWRNAIFIPILKPGKPAAKIESFRPVSLTSTLVKTLERMIHHRLYNLAESRVWFSHIQAGFRKRRICKDQLLRLVEKVSDGFQRGGSLRKESWPSSTCQEHFTAY